MELTDKPPYEDDGGGHYHRFTHYWCRGCVDRSRIERQLRKSDQELEGTNLDPIPSARFLVPERLPIPDDL